MVDWKVGKQLVDAQEDDLGNWFSGAGPGEEYSSLPCMLHPLVWRCGTPPAVQVKNTIAVPASTGPSMETKKRVATLHRHAGGEGIAP
jgi:hypothetical protein